MCSIVKLEEPRFHPHPWSPVLKDTERAWPSACAHGPSQLELFHLMVFWVIPGYLLYSYCNLSSEWRQRKRLLKREMQKGKGWAAPLRSHDSWNPHPSHSADTYTDVCLPLAKGLVTDGSQQPRLEMQLSLQCASLPCTMLRVWFPAL